MKKFLVAVCALLCATPAFAYYGDYYYSSRDDEMSGFAIFTLIIMIIYIILSVVLLVRWWKMTTNIKLIKEQLTYNESTPEFLVLVGEKGKARKVVLSDLVERLVNVYNTDYYYNKAEAMNEIIQEKQPKIERMGLTMPDYVTSGEKFIDYVNALTGHNVKYSEEYGF